MVGDAIRIFIAGSALGEVCQAGAIAVITVNAIPVILAHGGATGGELVLFAVAEQRQVWFALEGNGLLVTARIIA